jgi:FkbM family methyltransferase
MRLAKRAQEAVHGALVNSIWRKRGPERRLITRPSPVVLDVGGNIGQSVQRYIRLFPAATIHSFEPFPSTYARLERVAARYPNVSAYRLALADAPGRCILNVSPAFAGTSSLLRRPTEGRRYFPRGAELTHTAEVDVTTVDAFCEENAISRIDVLKIDVQGAERLVLEGANGLLGRAAIDVVFCEVAFVPHYEGGVLYHDLAQYLGDFGYTLLDLIDHVRAGNGQLRYSNALFLSAETRRRTIDNMAEEA